MNRFTKFLALTLSLSAYHAFAQQNNNNPCATAEARQFDFWIGEWEVFTGENLAGKNKISSASGGCALLEEYVGVKGYQGKSLNFFNTAIAKWQQIWVGSAGDILLLTGDYKVGRMILEGESTQQGKKVLDRITWHNNATEGTVRQVWEKSSDEGKTWNVVFDGLYKKKQ
jgi:hypothetical protein